MLVRGWNNLYYDTVNFSSANGFSFDEKLSAVRVFLWNSTAMPQCYYLDTLCFGVFGIPTCMLDFDDAHKSISVGLDYMIENNMTSTVYTPTGLIGGSSYLSISQILDYSRHTIDFANHTVNHTDLTVVNNDLVYSEIMGASEWLSKYGLERGASKLALPYGKFNDNVLSICQSIGLDSVRTTIPNYVDVEFRNLSLLPSFAFGSTTNFNAVQRVLETALVGGLSVSILFHRLSDMPQSTLEFCTNDFFKLIDYLNFSNFKVNSISDFISVS
jgi:hypothetical protein